MSKTQNDIIPEHLEATIPKKSQRGFTDTIDTQQASLIKPNFTEEELERQRSRQSVKLDGSIQKQENIEDEKSKNVNETEQDYIEENFEDEYA